MGDVLAEAVLVHDPVRALAAGGTAAVEDERLAEAVDAAVAGDAPVLARGLPVARGRGAVGARPVGVLAVAGAEKEPFQVSFRQERLLCDTQLIHGTGISCCCANSTDSVNQLC